MSEIDQYANVNLGLVAEQMARFASDLGFLGCAVVALVRIPEITTGEFSYISASHVTRSSRKPDTIHRGADDRGTNYMGMAAGKIAYAIRQASGLDTGPPDNRKGEPGVGGFSIRKLNDYHYLVTAYSGAPNPEDDKTVAEKGVGDFLHLLTAATQGLLLQEFQDVGGGGYVKRM